VNREGERAHQWLLLYAWFSLRKCVLEEQNRRIFLARAYRRSRDMISRGEAREKMVKFFSDFLV